MKKNIRLPESLPRPLLVLLRRFDQGQRLLVALERLATGVLATGGTLLAAFLFDRLVDLDGWWRQPFPWCVLTLSVVTLFAVLLALFRRGNWDETAHRLDRLRGDGRDQLRSMIDFAGRADGGGPLAGLSLTTTLSFWQETDPVRLLPRRRALRLGAAMLSLLLVLGIAILHPWMRAPLLWQRFLDPTGNYSRPTATWFTIIAPSTLNGGDDFILQARLAGEAIDNPRPLARIQSGDEAPVTRPLTLQEDGHFALTLSEVQSPFTCTLVMGNLRSEEHRIQVIPRPTITRVEVTYNYPTYTGRKPETKILSGRTLTALDGTKARIVVTSSLPLANFTALSAEERISFRLNSRVPEEATRFHFMSRNERIDVVLTASNGLESKGELPFNIRTLPDAPPTVQLNGQGLDRAYYAHETVTIPYQAQDDLGLAEVAIQALPGSYQQEAELPRHGATKVEGLLRIPVGLLVRPGLREVKLRLQAIDLKGQTVLSQAVTVRIAINSYDRQLRTARNSLLGIYNSRDLSQSGFPNLDYHGTTRLGAVRTLRSKLLILGEGLSENEKIGENQAKDVETIRALIQQLEPRPRYLLPSIGQRPDDITTPLTLLGGSPMTPRLSRLIADTTCGGDLAISGEALNERLTAILGSLNPKAGLMELHSGLDSTISQQEDLVERLTQTRDFLNLELAGTLTAALSRDLSTTDEALFKDHDFILAATLKLKEIDELLSSGTMSIPGLTEEDRAAIHKVAADPAEMSLRSLSQPLTALSTALVARGTVLAGKESAWRLPLDTYDRTAGNGKREEWLDVASLVLFMQADDEGRDEVDYAWQLARQLSRRSGTPLTGTDISPASVRNLQLLTTANRIASLARDLRTGLLTGEFLPGDPAAESLWILLRERRFELLTLVQGEPADSPLHTLTAPLITGGEALARWSLPEGSPMATADLLGSWTTAAQTLAEHCRKQGREEISTTAILLEKLWRPLIHSSLTVFRQSITRRIEEIQALKNPEEPYAVQNAVFGPLPQMYARIKEMQLFIIQCLALSSLTQIETGATPFPENHLTALLQLLRQVEKDLFGEVGSPISNVAAGLKRDDNAMAAAAQKGKVTTWKNLDALVAVIEQSTLPDTTPAGAEEELAKRNLFHHVERDREAAASALMQTTPFTPARLLELKANTDGAGLLYEAFLLPLSELAESRQEKHTLPQADWTSLSAALTALGEMPKGLEGLPDLLAQMAKTPGEISDDDLFPLRDRLRELSRAATPPSGGEVLFMRQRTLLREQVTQAVLGKASVSPAVQWAAVEAEWSRRKATAAEKNVGIAGLAIGGEDDLSSLKLPKHLYLELKRAREQAMPELYRERSTRYLNTLLEKAR